MDLHNYDILVQEIERYKHLLEGYFEDTLTPEERSDLAKWIIEDRKNRELFWRIKNSNGLRDYYLRGAQIDPVTEFRMLMKRMPQVRKQHKIRLLLRYAAVGAIVTFALSLWLFLIDRTPTYRSNAPIATMLSRPKATLQTSDGEVFEFDGSKSIKGNNKFVYVDSLQQLIYKEPLISEITMTLASLDVPQGGEFKMTLPDGTKVWLNSESLIRFPGNFLENKREVFVCGEVYFEVAKDTSRPFIVNVGEMRIEVLGTCFGISAYEDELVWQTVLAEGRVMVSYRDKSIELTPHKKAVIENGEFFEKPADISKELAWINRDFVFVSDRLEDVVRRLERWYIVSFNFTDDSLRDYRFTGSVNRDLGIEEILNLIEKMNVVSFEQKDGRIYVMRI